MNTIEASYDDGVLRPTERLNLEQGERVHLIVLRRPDPQRWDFDRLKPSPDEDVALAEQGLAEWADALDQEDRR